MTRRVRSLVAVLLLALAACGGQSTAERKAACQAEGGAWSVQKSTQWVQMQVGTGQYKQWILQPRSVTSYTCSLPPASGAN